MPPSRTNERPALLPQPQPPRRPSQLCQASRKRGELGASTSVLAKRRARASHEVADSDGPKVDSDPPPLSSHAESVPASTARSAGARSDEEAHVPREPAPRREDRSYVSGGDPRPDDRRLDRRRQDLRDAHVDLRPASHRPRAVTPARPASGPWNPLMITPASSARGLANVDPDHGRAAGDAVSVAGIRLECGQASPPARSEEHDQGGVGRGGRAPSETHHALSSRSPPATRRVPAPGSPGRTGPRVRTGTGSAAAAGRGRSPA